ncbi:MAG: tetratricopeptide repeat protein [Anaeromyxobacter sp.]
MPTPTRPAVPLALLLAAVAAAAPAARAGEADRIPITTPSAEARALYVEGRAFAEALRANDARPKFEAAIAKDPDFALAHFGLAGVAFGGQAFFDSVKRAVELASKVSSGERHLILALAAGARGDREAQEKELAALRAEYPKDPRALVPTANVRFAQQRYEETVKLYEEVIALEPTWAFPYNQLGYANRFLGRYDAAERAFARYVALVPNDPNPPDSLGELYLKAGKFEQGIASYRKALEIDPAFFSSYVGIANCELGLGRPAAAREALAKLRALAKNAGDVRTSVFWTAITWLHEGKPDQALQAFEENLKQSRGAGDLANHSADLVVAANIQLHAGKYDAAMKSFEGAVKAMEQAKVDEQVKEGVRRNHLFFAGWVAAMRGDLATARRHADAYRARATAKGLPFELRRVHELDGHLALLGKDPARAAAELREANQNDPYVVTLLARALEGAGRPAEARAAWREAAGYNEIGFPISWAFVRAEATRREKALPPS